MSDQCPRLCGQGTLTLMRDCDLISLSPNMMEPWSNRIRQVLNLMTFVCCGDHGRPFMRLIASAQERSHAALGSLYDPFSPSVHLSIPLCPSTCVYLPKSMGYESVRDERRVCCAVWIDVMPRRRPYAVGRKQILFSMGAHLEKTFPTRACVSCV